MPESTPVRNTTLPSTLPIAPPPFRARRRRQTKRENRRMVSTLRFFPSYMESRLLEAERLFLRRYGSHLFSDQLGNDSINHRIGAGPNLFFGQRHDRMRDGHNLIRGNAKILTLQTGCSNKLGGRDIGGWDAMLFKVGNIVRTARNARPSRADRFNDSMTTRENVLPHFRLGHASGGRLSMAHNRSHAVAIFQHSLNPIEENVAVRKTNI